VDLAVHEVAEAAERLAQDDRRRARVGEFPERDLVPGDPPPAGEGAADQAAVDREAAVPDRGDFDGIRP
jgi:hypothetical protein